MSNKKIAIIGSDGGLTMRNILTNMLDSDTPELKKLAHMSFSLDALSPSGLMDMELPSYQEKHIHTPKLKFFKSRKVHVR